MKLEVIGWTYDTNRRYPLHSGHSGAVLRAVVNALREGGYKFGGNSHEDAMTGTPVLNDGTRVCYSWRGWGGVMAKALNLRNEDGYSYMSWYMDTMEVMLGGTRREIILPPWGVDEKRIVKRAALSETFELELCPSAFEAVAAGKKTVELCLCDEQHECVCRNDFIEFFCGEKRCRVHVTNAEVYDDLEDLFSAERLGSENDRRFAHRLSLLKRARFEGCNTAEEQMAALRALCPPAPKKGPRRITLFMAISFRLAEEPRNN